MSEEQLSALLAKLKEDAGFRDKLQGIADLDVTTQKWKVSEQIDAAAALVQKMGFDVSREDLLTCFRAPVELSDAELESCAGGVPCSVDADVVKGFMELFSLNHMCK